MNGEKGMESYQDRCSSAPLKLFSLAADGGSSPSSGGVGAGYIEHHVSRFDTLAGVAIKYGVEVADIKRINGLVTDLQMFALKSLYIPLPGRHPPSSSLSNAPDTIGQIAPEQSPTTCRHSYLLESSFKLKSSPYQKLSPATSKLQGYYGLQPADHKFKSDIFSQYLENGPDAPPPPRSLHRKSRSVANGLFAANGILANDISAGDANFDKGADTLIRRRQKSEADFTDLPMKDGNGYSSIKANGLALRQKASRNAPATDSETGSQCPNGDSLGHVDTFSTMRKSSSASNLQEQDTSMASFIWPTSKWNLKPDLQVFSNASITKPIFDGIPKPTGWKNKAALD